MIIPPISDTTGVTPRPDPSSTAGAAASAASDFKSFLSLLTAQLRNQDPLSPLDSTQFVEQLASFSSVEQQVKSNQLLEEIAGGLGAAAGLEEATQWIGKEVEAETGVVRFNGEDLNFRLPPSAVGTTNEVVIRDRNNSVIFREDVRVGQNTFTWNGVDSGGFVVPQGEYTISVPTFRDDALIGRPLPSINARVTEARLVNGAMQLILENGNVVEPGSITAVRESIKSNVLS